MAYSFYTSFISIEKFTSYIGFNVCSSGLIQKWFVKMPLEGVCSGM